MSKPTITVRDAIRYLESQGFTTVSHKGSHKKMQKDLTKVIIPVNGRKTLSPGCLAHVNRELKKVGIETL